MEGWTGALRWRAAARAASALLILLAAAPAAKPAELSPFEATFTVEWHGMAAGTARLALQSSDPGHWLYTSENRARGIFRVAVPGTIRQSSEIRIESGQVIPQHFVTDDGNDNSTKRDADVRFDWDAGRATGTAEGKTIDTPLRPGVQDELSVQIAMIHELLEGRTPTGFVLLDGAEVKDFEYITEGPERVETALGPQDTVRYRTRRPDSTHSTMFWCAPDLGYLPVKVERHKGDKVEWSMSLQKLERG